MGMSVRLAPLALAEGQTEDSLDSLWIRAFQTEHDSFRCHVCPTPKSIISALDRKDGVGERDSRPLPVAARDP